MLEKTTPAFKLIVTYNPRGRLPNVAAVLGIMVCVDAVVVEQLVVTVAIALLVHATRMIQQV